MCHRSGFLVLLSVLLSTMLMVQGCAKRVNPMTDPTDAAAGAGTIFHTVEQGETLRRIAENYYGSPDRAADIAERNGITDPNRIMPGSVLILDFDATEMGGARRRSVALDAYNKGVEFMGQDRLAPAENQFRLALETWPEMPSASYNLALVLARRGRHSESLGILEVISEKDPTNTDFLFARGHALFSMTYFAEAAIVFEKVLALDPGHQRAAFSGARCHQEAGHTQKAIGAWEYYLTLDSKSSWAETARRNLKKLR